MANAIWKFSVPIQDRFAIDMPVNARVLSVQVQHGQPQMWVLGDPYAPKESRSFIMYGTGHDMPNDPGEFVGTFQVHGGNLVFHLFAVA